MAREWRQGLRDGVARLRGAGTGENRVLLASGLAVGVGAGVGAIIFRALITLFSTFFFGTMRTALGGVVGPAAVIALPALGGLVYGPLIYRFAREAKGHGVPEVMAAVALRGGRIRPSVAVVKSLASALCIGSGGSVGREGPIVQIGSTIGSVTGQLFKMSDQRVRTLVACGAAGGIAATFNAPIAGVFFALELILGEFSARSFGVVVISSVTAAVIGRSAFGDVPAFVVPAYQLIHLSEYAFYAILGCSGGSSASASPGPSTGSRMPSIGFASPNGSSRCPAASHSACWGSSSPRSSGSATTRWAMRSWGDTVWDCCCCWWSPKPSPSP